MDGVGIQPKAHQNDLAVQFLFKKRNDGNTSPTSLRNWRFSEGLFISFASSLVTHRVNRRYVWIASMMRLHFYPNAIWSQAFKMFLE